MNPIEMIADVSARSMEFLKGTLADFSDADMFVRPTPAANHANWQLGHLIASEVQMLGSLAPGKFPTLPAGFADKYNTKTSKIDDPVAFCSKAELLELAGKMRAATVAWIKQLTPEIMNQPGPEQLRSMAPTVGHLVLLVPQHVAMHVGQIQVTRRKLGKPVMF